NSVGERPEHPRAARLRSRRSGRDPAAGIPVISILDNEAPLDYHYGSALGSSRVHQGRVGHSWRTRQGGESPMNSLGVRTASMLDCLERIDAPAPPPAAGAPSDPWLEVLPPAVARHPDEDEDVGEGEIEDEEDLDEDFDEDEEEFDDEDF